MIILAGFDCGWWPETGFLSGYLLQPRIWEKTRFLRLCAVPRNRVFARIFGNRRRYGKKPGFFDRAEPYQFLPHPEQVIEITLSHRVFKRIDNFLCIIVRPFNITRFSIATEFQADFAG
jgi:hypothetical protein